MATPAAKGIPRWVLRDTIALASLKLVVGAIVILNGFRAVSDDDYSRLVIAQSFAQSPRLDPSGTSWLPLPFWIYGGAFAAIGPSLIVARAVALVLGVASVLLLWKAARTLGATPRGALWGALLGAIFPYSAWLGVATVPEAPTAALIVFGLSTLVADDRSSRATGGLALAAACFCRYEAWPAAGAFALFSVFDAVRKKRLDHAFFGLGALAPIGLWLLHGVFVHGDAWFFVQRVTAYRAALGLEEASWFTRLASYPLALVRYEPELVLLAATALGLALSGGLATVLRRYRRLALGLAAILAFTVAGELRGGTPTHHSERVLLALWFGLAIFAGDLGTRAVSRLTTVRAAWGLGASLVVALGATSSLRSRLAERSSFADRSLELSIGEAAREALSSQEDATGKLLIGTDDFGYFAVIAAFGDPSRATPLAAHDPREQRRGDLFSQPEALRRALGTAQARWLVAPSRHETSLAGVGQVIARNPAFTLLDLRRAPPGALEAGP